MKAEAAAQLRLLELADLDTRIAQLRYGAAHLEERPRIAEVERRVTDLRDRARDAGIVRDDLQAVVRKSEADVETVRQRRERDQRRVDDGSVTNPGDLQHLIEELAAIDRRIATLEDEELAAMAAAEEAVAVCVELEQELAAAEQELAGLKADLDVKTAELSARHQEAQAERAPLVAGLPADLRDLYEKVRQRTGDTGAALLRRRQCQGCMLALDAGELATVRAAAVDDVVRCDECSRILVRTGESGL